MQVHARIPDLSTADFQLWLKIFQDVVSDLFQYELAEEISQKAGRIAQSLKMGYDFHNAKKVA